MILTFNILNVFADISWLYQGMEEFSKIVIRDTIFKITNIAFIFIFDNYIQNLLIFSLIDKPLVEK